MYFYSLGLREVWALEVIHMERVEWIGDYRYVPPHVARKGSSPFLPPFRIYRGWGWHRPSPEHSLSKRGTESTVTVSRPHSDPAGQKSGSKQSLQGLLCRQRLEHGWPRAASVFLLLPLSTSTWKNCFLDTNREQLCARLYNDATPALEPHGFWESR